MITSFFALICAPLLAAAGEELSRFEAVEPHMGTLFRITLYASGPESARDAFAAAFDRIRQLDQKLSDYNSASELMQVCREAHRHPVEVSADLFTVLAAAQKLSAETEGAFDVTLGPVIRLWREARRDHRLPDQERVKAAGRRCGFRNLVLEASRRTVFLKLDGMQLDLGAIAKGYAADEALRVLRTRGIARALVAASGDLAIGDAPPGKDGWRVGAGSRDRVIIVRNQAVSTSGDSEQFLESGGRRYSHIIDPVTLTGLTSGITVTVVAKRGLDADPLATAVSVLGVERGMKFIESQPGASARIATPAGVRESTGFPR